MKKSNAPRVLPANIDHQEEIIELADLIRILDGPADEEAKRLLAEHGICAENKGGDSWPLEEAVRRMLRRNYDQLRSDAYDDFGLDVEKPDSEWPEPQRRKLHDRHEELRWQETQDCIHAAYLIGVAMGRRLGFQTLTRGGAR